MLKPYFESVTGYELKSGIRVLIKVIVEFHEQFGLSLNIIDIEPSYTLGDIEKRRLEIIKNLENSGVINMNKELDFPIVPQKIAIISSETAAGYEDFINQLNNNLYRYKFYCKLFPAIMQGNKAEDSIIEALEKIYVNENIFDVVVIIRGGGSKTDLNCFDNENLAFNICQFPLPVITGIGHDRDVSIADLVAHSSQKTPTAVAEFLINQVNDFENLLNESKNQFCSIIENYLDEEKYYLNNISFKFNNLINKHLSKISNKLSLTENNFYISINKYISDRNYEIKILISQINEISKKTISSKKEILNKIILNLENSMWRLILKKKHDLEIYEKVVKYQHPNNILNRGYSITKLNGKILKNSNDLKTGDYIETELSEGNIKSLVTDKDF
jgi:exodeoxyribonuclease VII large subunit